MEIRKLANAFVPTATPWAYIPSTPLRAIHRFKAKHGGLWVGGTITVSQIGVTFEPNTLNDKVHEELEAVFVAAQDIRGVRHEFGWFTGIIVVDHSGGEFRFRCYGAKHLAATMSALFTTQAALPGHIS